MASDDSERSELQARCQRLESQLAAQAREINLLRARFARYEMALRGSQVTVFTQDRDLRYTALSNPIMGRPIEEVLGRTDEELMGGAEGTGDIIKIKREALTKREPTRQEVSCKDDAGVRWHDLHIEPLFNEDGDIIGLTGASIDVTERKESEAHLRLLLRELTHRSKNLLAVIQAMARQTGRYAGTIDTFLTQFSARLQALAASHDLLVRDSWHGASLRELVQSQLVRFKQRGDGQVTIDGPPVALRPEAAQNLGLALHELASNAEQYGSLSVPQGRLTVTWNWQRADKGEMLALDWHEELGPVVQQPDKKGFGSMVIERNLARALDAEVAMDFNADGLRCRVAIPASQIHTARNI